LSSEENIMNKPNDEDCAILYSYLAAENEWTSVDKIGDILGYSYKDLITLVTEAKGEIVSNDTFDSFKASSGASLEELTAMLDGVIYDIRGLTQLRDGLVVLRQNLRERTEGGKVKYTLKHSKKKR
jgi:hypothetical protein